MDTQITILSLKTTSLKPSPPLPSTEQDQFYLRALKGTVVLLGLLNEAPSQLVLGPREVDEQ